MTRETVARETPAASATSSRVGRRFSLITRFYSTTTESALRGKYPESAFASKWLPVDAELPEGISVRRGADLPVHAHVPRVAADVDVVESAVTGRGRVDRRPVGVVVGHLDLVALR